MSHANEPHSSPVPAQAPGKRGTSRLASLPEGTVLLVLMGIGLVVCVVLVVLLS